MDCSDNVFSKEMWLKNMPVFSNTVECTGVYTDNPDISQMHMHEFVEISIVIGGEGIHLSLDGAEKCKTGDVYIINTGVPHGYFAEDEFKKPTVCNLLFDPEDIFAQDIALSENQDYCYGIFRHNAFIANTHLEPNDLNDALSILKNIVKESEQRLFQWQSLAKAHLTNLLIYLARHPQKNLSDTNAVSRSDRIMVSKVMQIISKKYSDSSVTLKSVASSLFISKSYLGHIFKRATGKYFSDYIKEVRIRHVCRLLTETDKTIEQIAHECGMKDMQSFYRLFKAKIKMTPKQYRQKIKNT